VAEDLVPDMRPARGAAATEIVPHRPHEQTSVFRRRFAVAYLVLAIIAGAGLGAAVLLFDRPEGDSEVAWSSWQPGGSPSTRPRQIADYVSGRYRLPSGNPLVAILSGPPEVQDVRVRAVAIQNDPEGNSDDISIVEIDKSVMYILCGLGARCAIAEGQPSEERHRLLRREALELSLYTFKYGDADSVIVLLPPRAPQSEDEEPTATALFFQRKDFRDELEQPLRRTLLAAEPPQVAEISSIEGPTIDRLTTPHLFSFEFQQAQEGSAILILAPVGR
jgi:hypothetical protein